jgi:1,2-diacylglycerol 3-beta-galactosyltransferase
MERLESNLCSDRKKKVSVIVASRSAGGHYATYVALRALIEQRQFSWKINVVDVDQFLDSVVKREKIFDVYRLFGTTGDQVIHRAQQKSWKFLQKLTTPLNKLLMKLNHKVGVKIAEEEFIQQQPDLVISVIPFFNKMIWEGLQKAKPGTPAVTILTDFADCPPSLWIEPATGMHVVCGMEKAVEQARSLGVREELIIQTSGMVIHPRFYEPITCDRLTERQRLGLDPDCLTGLVLFGGCGSKQMLDIARNLERFQQNLQLIFICGRNEEVATALHEMNSVQKRFITTFTPDIPYYMHLSDFFVGKPGPGSLSEAIAMKLPVIVECNADTLRQEKYNADWVRQKQVGLVIPSYQQIQQAVATLMEPENLARYRDNVAAINNRAVFEIPEILQQLLEGQVQTTVTRSPEQRVYRAEQTMVPG